MLRSRLATENIVSMGESMDQLDVLLKKPEFPRSQKYSTDWMLDNQMGPSSIWLLEWLCERLQISPGSRILDLGCGKAMTSVFLAREYGAKVWATDLWIGPDNNWRRIREAGLTDQICPIKAEAHSLPFAEGFFDAAISIDAYQYFGTDDLYIDYLARFVRPGGSIGIVVVGLMQDFAGPPPDYLTQPQKNGKVFWDPTCRCFKTPHFWKQLWQGSASITKVEVEPQRDGWRHWRDFELALERTGKGIFPSEAEALEADHGRYLGFLRLIAERSDARSENIYDPALGERFGVDK